MFIIFLAVCLQDRVPLSQEMELICSQSSAFGYL